MDIEPSSTRPPSAAAIADLEADLRAIVGEEYMRQAAPEDCLEGVSPSVVLEPGTVEELARVLKTATEAGVHVIPRGGASKMEWGNLPRWSDLIVSTRRLNRIVEHAWADMTTTVEAGCSFQELQRALAQHGQRLALDPLWPEKATVGGIVGTNDSGPLRVRYGTLRDLLIGITLVLPDGTIAKSGGKVVKNVAGYDLPKLAIGSLGTLGIIAQAIFRLHPLPRQTRTLCFRVKDYRAMNELILSVLDSTLVPTGLQIRARGSEAPEVDVRFEGTAGGCEQQIEQVSRLTGDAMQIESDADAWNARAGLWSGNEPSLAGNFSLLPARLEGLFDLLKTTAERQSLSWRAVAQGVGVGLLRLEGASYSVLLAVIRELRQSLEQGGGSLVILHCPAEIKSQIDVWGSAGDTLHLMQNIKAQFDPAGTLNPGRFIAGI